MLLVCLVSLLVLASATDAPIVGILGVPSPDPKECAGATRRGPGGLSSCFGAFYVRWLEQAGIRVVPIAFDIDDEKLDYYASRLNGFLFTGGGLDLVLNSTYVETAQKLFQLAQRPVNPIPLWATCQGFQLLHVLQAQSQQVLSSGFDAEDISWPLDFAENARQSRLYSSLPQIVFDNLGSLNITMNFHHDAVEPVTYSKYPRLSQFFDVLSTNTDRKGRVFISSVEAKTFPIFGTQYHPERQSFEFNSYDVGLNHSPESIVANNALGLVFAQRCRQNTNGFENITDSYAHLIYNYQPIYEGGSNQIYLY